jgi:hypothetical protein
MVGMTPPEQHLSELLDRWLQSLELHRRYARLDDAAYARAQPWPEHTRPAAWIVEHAYARALELKAQVEARRAAGDRAFAESLEQAIQLAVLVGLQDIARYIPLAEASREPPGDTVLMPVAVPPPAAAAAPEPPRLVPEVFAPAAPAEPATPGVAAPSPLPPTPGAPAASEEAAAQVIADAVRLLKWGREWHELAPAISRMAGRPTIVELRRILRTHKAAIEAAARD